LPFFCLSCRIAEAVGSERPRPNPEKIPRAAAGLEVAGRPEAKHIAEAIQYRTLVEGFVRRELMWCSEFVMISRTKEMP
jgi:hypothetical protein